MIPKRHFYMIRHGETEANAREIMAGSLDSPLNAKGRRQAEQARLIVEQLAVKPSKIFHSHLSRARDTASIINTNLGLPMTEDTDLAEIHVGELEGVPYAECADILNSWADAPGGETHRQFLDRVARAKHKALKEPGPVLIVSHGGVFRALWKLYGHEIPGVRNAHLHEFTPRLEPSLFPFMTHVYDYDQALIRSEAIYHNEDDIA